jgi:hypothetical protein
VDHVDDGKDVAAPALAEQRDRHGEEADRQDRAEDAENREESPLQSSSEPARLHEGGRQATPRSADRVSRERPAGVRESRSSDPRSVPIGAPDAAGTSIIDGE